MSGQAVIAGPGRTASPWRRLRHEPAALAGGGALLVAFAPELGGWMQQLLADGLRFDRSALDTPGVMVERLASLALRLVLVVIPIGLAMAAVALGAGVACGGWNWTLEPLSPKLHVLNPIAGAGRMFSKQQLLTALKACLLALVLGAIGALYLHAHVPDFADALTRPVPAAISHTHLLGRQSGSKHPFTCAYRKHSIWPPRAAAPRSELERRALGRHDDLGRAARGRRDAARHRRQAVERGVVALRVMMEEHEPRHAGVGGQAHQLGVAGG